MQWYETERGEARIANELELVRSAFPSFDIQIMDDGRLAWIGKLGPSDLLEGQYAVAIVCPSTYMTGRVPRVEVLDPPIPSNSPHRFTDASLCVEHRNFHANTPITDVMGWAHQWLALFEDYLKTGTSW